MAILDEVVKVVKPSNQKFIKRYHLTDVSNVPSIMRSGLNLKYVGKGIGSELNPQKLNRGIFTSANDFYLPHDGTVRLEIDIPKEDYRNLGRFERNYYTADDDAHDYGRTNYRNMHTVQQHGRTDIFKKDLKPEWIRYVETGDGKKYTPQEFYKNLGCEPEYEGDKCYDFLNAMGLVEEELDQPGYFINVFPW